MSKVLTRKCEPYNYIFFIQKLVHIGLDRVKKSALGFREPNLRFLMVPKIFTHEIKKFAINYLLI